VRHLLTGAGSGIGAAIADRLYSRGDELVLLARSERRAEDIAESFPNAQVLVADLSDPASFSELPQQDGLDSLIHAAGVVDLARIGDVALDSVRDQVDVNLIAPIMLTQACLPALRASRGTVVFINSTAGITANANWGAYAASKFGIRAIADCLRAEEAPNGVRVSTVFPGRTATAMQEQVHSMEGRAFEASHFIRPETVAARVLDLVDLGPDATVTELVVRPN
jgi:short-subunit dehydrogenase